MATVTLSAQEVPLLGEFEVVVGGGGPAGIGAALAAARQGARTLLVEQYGCLGGMMTSGLHTHMNQLNVAGGGEECVRGIPLEIVEKTVAAGYGEYAGGMFDFEVEYMKRFLEELLQEAGVTLLYYTFVTGALVEEGAVRGLFLTTKQGLRAVRAEVVVDATGDADIAASAGVPFQQGREKDGRTQPVTLMFRVGGCDTAKVKDLQRREGWKLNAIWEKAIADGVMAPFQTELMGFWYCASRPDEIGVNFTNITGIDATDPWERTRATIEGRRQVEQTVAVMQKYIPGCEGAYLIDTAAMLGVRETRRIIGEYTLTLEDILNTRKFPDSIARGSFFVDIHNPEGTGLAPYTHHLPPGTYYDIPYRCLLPKGVENLLVAGRCISTTHEALGSTRVMFQCMALGQAAGTAAALAGRKGITPRALSTDLLRETLLAAGALV